MRSHRHAAIAALATVLGLAFWAPPALSQTVYCYDASRQLLRQVPAQSCHGQIVDAQMAEEIRQQRRDYVRRALDRHRAEAQSRPSAVGSGFFVSKNGFVMTNHHVVAECRRITVLTSQGRTIRARLVAASPRDDLALLRVTGRAPAVATFAFRDPDPGGRVAIVGYPARKRPRVQPLTIAGRYLGERKARAGQTVLDLAATIWRGSSGSPVVDESGAVIGVVFAKIDVPAVYSRSGIAPPERAFAMPSRAVLSFLGRQGVAARKSSNRARPSADAPAYAARINCIR